MNLRKNLKDCPYGYSFNDSLLEALNKSDLPRNDSHYILSKEMTQFIDNLFPHPSDFSIKIRKLVVNIPSLYPAAVVENQFINMYSNFFKFVI